MNRKITPQVISVEQPWGYFKMVETTLEPLCNNNGWSLDKSKTTCVRIRLNREAHIDLPLYAIPDEDFVQLSESAARSQVAKGMMATDTDEIIFAEHVYRNLPEDRIMLARRDTKWIESDPRKIEDWFLGAVREHGEVLRRVCRYLKGWRDFQWKKGGPSSLALMNCAVSVFDEMDGTLPKNRDDLAMQTVIDRLPDLVSGPIPNPVLPNQFLDEHWSPEDRNEFKARAVDLKVSLDTVLNSTYHKRLALSHLQGSFGDRIPDDELLIDIDSEEREVLVYKPAYIAAPVPRTISG